MPVTYKIYPETKLIHTRCTGGVTIEEVIAHFRELEQDPERPDHLNVLLDLSEETSLPDTQELRVASHEIKRLRRSVQFQACAIVAGCDALFGMMRMFEVFAHDYFSATQVFRTTTEAKAWLGESARVEQRGASS